MDRYLFDLLARHGTPLVFLMQALGVVGVPIPAELLLTFAGVLIRRGVLNGSAAVTAAIAGSLTGTTLSYVLGRMVGPRVLKRLSAFDATSVKRGQAWFTRSGTWLLAFGCFVPGVRHLTPIMAGAAPLDFRTFAAYAYPGTLLWTVSFVAAGYYSSDHWRQAALLLRAHVIGVTIVFAALAIGYVTYGGHGFSRATRHR